MVTGVSAWQGVPLSGTLDISIPGRYVDSSGNATVRHYSGVLRTDGIGGPRWVNALNPNENLWVVVQGPTDPAGQLATFNEILSYGPQKDVRTTFTRRLVSSDLNGLFFDYAQPAPVNPAGFGIEPLTMQAARDLLNDAPGVFDELGVVLADIRQGVADTEQYADRAAQLFGGTSVADQAAIPAAAGLYFPRDVASAGMPFERLASGALNPRPDLQVASKTALAALQADTTGRLLQIGKTTESVINAGNFSLQGYPVDDSARFATAMLTATTLGIRRLYIPTAPATAFDPNASSGPLEPHYLCGPDVLLALGDFEIYGDPGGKTIIRNLTDKQRCIIGGQAGPGAQIPGFRLRDITLWGRADEHAEDYSGQYEHSHLLDLNGYDDAEITKVVTNAPVGDGIYLGGGRAFADRLNNTDIRIIDCGGDGVNWFNRNWLSVITVDGLLVSRPWTRRFCANVPNYRAPGSIDLEPNHLEETIRNVYIHDVDLESDGGPGVIAVNLSKHPDDYTRHPYNIKVERGRIRGIGKGTKRAENGVFAGGNLVRDESRPRFKSDSLIQFVDLDIADAVRPFSAIGVGGFSITGRAKRFAAAALLGYDDDPNSQTTSKAFADVEFGTFNDGPLALFNVDDLTILGSATDSPKYVIGISGSASRITIAPRSLTNVPLPVEFTASLTTTPTENRLILPQTATAQQRLAIVRPAGTNAAVIQSGLPLDTPAALAPSGYPFGHSTTLINGGAGWPTPLGVADTQIVPGFGAGPGGLGFCYQTFVDRDGKGSWIRTSAAPDTQGAGWGPFRYQEGRNRPSMPSGAYNLAKTNTALYPGKFPVGLSHMTINPATNYPAGAGPLGMLMTYVDDAYGYPGPAEGFAWQMYLCGDVGGAYRPYIRFAANIAGGTAWGDWQQMAFTPKSAPADTAGATLTIGAAYTQAEVQALEARVRDQGAIVNQLSAALKAAGVLT